MNNTALDICLEYLNTGKIDEISFYGEMIENETFNFENLLEQIDAIDEAFSLESIKESIKKIITTIIQKIKDFVSWLKNKVIQFFGFIAKKIKSSGESIKKLYEKAKKKKNVNESYIYESAKLSVDNFDSIKTCIPKYFTPRDFCRCLSDTELEKAEEKFAEKFGDKTELSGSDLDDCIEILFKKTPNEIIKPDEKDCMTFFEFMEFENDILNATKIADHYIEDLKEYESEAKFYEKYLTKINSIKSEEDMKKFFKEIKKYKRYSYESDAIGMYNYDRYYNNGIDHPDDIPYDESYITGLKQFLSSQLSIYKLETGYNGTLIRFMKSYATNCTKELLRAKSALSS